MKPISSIASSIILRCQHCCRDDRNAATSSCVLPIVFPAKRKLFIHPYHSLFIFMLLSVLVDLIQFQDKVKQFERTCYHAFTTVWMMILLVLAAFCLCVSLQRENCSLLYNLRPFSINVYVCLCVCVCVDYYYFFWISLSMLMLLGLHLSFIDFHYFCHLHLITEW